MHNYVMTTIDCPHCGKEIYLKILRELEYKSEDELLNELMDEIAEEQGEVGCYI